MLNPSEEDLRTALSACLGTSATLFFMLRQMEKNKEFKNLLATFTFNNLMDDIADFENLILDIIEDTSRAVRKQKERE